MARGVKSTLRDQLQAAPNLASFITLVAELGYTFTEEEWRDVTRFSVEEVPSKLSEIPGIAVFLVTRYTCYD